MDTSSSTLTEDWQAQLKEELHVKIALVTLPVNGYSNLHNCAQHTWHISQGQFWGRRRIQESHHCLLTYHSFLQTGSTETIPQLAAIPEISQTDISLCRVLSVVSVLARLSPAILKVQCVELSGIWPNGLGCNQIQCSPYVFICVQSLKNENHITFDTLERALYIYIRGRSSSTGAAILFFHRWWHPFGSIYWHLTQRRPIQATEWLEREVWGEVGGGCTSPLVATILNTLDI